MIYCQLALVDAAYNCVSSDAVFMRVHGPGLIPDRIVSVHNAALLIKSQPFNDGFKLLCPLCTEISTDSLNLLMTLCTINNESCSHQL